MKKYLFKLALIVFFIFSLFILLSFGVKGRSNDPNFYNLTKNTEVGGPFEATNSNSRYALVESLVNNHTVFFDKNQTAFSAPDVVVYRSKAFTIFTPGVSLIAAPFYYLGKIINLPQITTYFATILFAIFNTFLVYFVARKLKASKVASYISAGVFLFATNALVYAFGLTQHHYSLTFILLSILNASEKRTWKNNILLGIYFGIAVLLDIPNAIMLLPIGIYVIAKSFEIGSLREKITIKIKISALLILLGLIPFALLFGIFNKEVTGSYIKLGQTIGRADFSKTVNLVKQPQAVSIYDNKQPFNPRNEILGLYTLLISNERSWIWYSPILLVGIFGTYLGYKKSTTKKLSILLISVVVTDILIYSMFGDPWGGWAFGPRYLIPSAGILASFIAPALDKFGKRMSLIVLFSLILMYSVYINVLGMMTTSSIPPKVEAEALQNPIPYTYEYNLDLAQTNNSKSYLYTTYFRDIVDVDSVIIIYSSLIILLLVIPLMYEWSKNKEGVWI